jgi:hypothetical protein
MGEANRRAPHCHALPLHTTVRCSARLTVDIIFDRDGMRALWKPPPPFPFKVTDEEITAYRRGRNDLMQEYGRAVGGNVWMVEPDANGARMDVITPERIDTKRLDIEGAA